MHWLNSFGPAVRILKPMMNLLLLITVAYLLFLLLNQLEDKITELEEWKQYTLLIFAFALIIELSRHGYIPTTSYRR